MAYNEAPPRAEYEAVNGQTIFPYTFKIFNDTDIKVYLTPVGNFADDALDLLTKDIDYTVDIDGDNGGDIELLSAATSGDKVTLVRSLPITREVEYQTSGDLLAETINYDQDYQTYLTADAAGESNRYISVPESAQDISTDLPNAVGDSYLKWNEDGTALENDTAIPDAVRESAASAAAALVSETNAAASESAAAVSETNAASSEAQTLVYRDEAEQFKIDAEQTDVALLEEVVANANIQNGAVNQDVLAITGTDEFISTASGKLLTYTQGINARNIQETTIAESVDVGTGNETTTITVELDTVSGLSVSDVLTGDTSGSTGTVVSITDNLVELNTLTGVFEKDETLNTATYILVNFTIDYNKLYILKDRGLTPVGSDTELQIGQSRPDGHLGSYLNTLDKVVYDENDVATETIALGEVKIDSQGNTFDLVNYLPLKNYFNDIVATGDIETKGQFVGKNACTAWVNFDGTTIPPAIRDSFNISDVAVGGAGTDIWYDLYFADEMDNTGYTIAGSSVRNTSANGPRMLTRNEDDHKGLDYVRICLSISNGQTYKQGDVSVLMQGGKN